MILLLLLIPFGLFLLTLGVSYYAYCRCFKRKKQKNPEPSGLIPGEGTPAQDAHMRDLVEKFRQMPYEDVYITSHDGLRLHGRYYCLKPGASVQIQFHGYRDYAVRSFCGGSEMLRQTERNALVVDQRAHGASEGNAITFGLQERYDCLSWVEYARERFGERTPIFITGVSMGAATVLMASDLPLPKNVAGILADCPYSSPRAIIRKVCGDMHLPPRLMYPFICLGARLFGRFQLTSFGAVDAVKEAKVPILLVHGGQDHFVPGDMSREILENCVGAAELVIFPEAGHAMSYLMDPERYQTVQKEFMEKCLESFYNSL